MEQLQQIAAQLGIDQSFYVIFVSITILYFVLSLVYLKPYQKLLELRKESIDGAKKQAQSLTAQAEAKFGEYRDRLRSVTDKARDFLRQAEDAARKEESAILGDAGTKAKVSLQNVQSQLDTERKSVVDAVSTEISALAVEVATKVLGRPVTNR